MTSPPDRETSEALAAWARDLPADVDEAADALLAALGGDEAAAADLVARLSGRTGG